jgi:hypothetical protein
MSSFGGHFPPDTPAIRYADCRNPAAPDCISLMAKGKKGVQFAKRRRYGRRAIRYADCSTRRMGVWRILAWSFTALP